MIVPAILLALGTLTTNGWAQNPTPFINEILPVAALPGGSGFTLTVNGTGYVSGSVVSWQLGTSSASLATTFVSATQLTAAVPASLIATAGTPAVTVVNPDTAPDEGTSNPLFLQVTDPTANVAFGTTSTGVGEGPFSVSVGDFNGDGKLDVAVANLCGSDPTCNSPGSVSILLGNGDGTFTPQPAVPVGQFPESVAVGDFNGDGSLDLAVVNSTNSTLSILLGSGDGTFTPEPAVSVGPFPQSAAVADFNGDGKLDLAVANYGGSTVSILLGNGDGTFTPPAAVSVGESPTSVVVGDFNGDGKLDLAVANCGTNIFTFLSCSPGYVAILLGNGDGTFTLQPEVSVGQSPTSVVVGDFNGDGKLDVAVGADNNTVSVLLGNGDGTFTTQPAMSVGASPISVAVGDFNGDGKLDLAVANGGGNTVSILLGNGDGTFTPQPAASVGLYPYSLAVGDFNGDGRLDVVTANDNTPGTVSILLQPPAPEVGVPQALAFGSQNLGAGNTLPLTITNSGTSALNITGVSVSGVNGPDFIAALNTCSSPVSPGASCLVNVSFTPSIVGAESAILTVTDNAGTGAQTVSLTGTGLQIPQTITFSAIPTQVQGTTVALTASASSGLTVSFTSLTTTVCTVSGAIATLINSGTCTIQASQGGSTTYAPATPVSEYFTVLATQTITFNTIPTQVQGTTVALTASASSGLTVSFSSLTITVCTVSGATATLINFGTCTIQASQNGNTVYAAATPVSQSFTVSPAANFTITATPPAETVYGGGLGAFILELQSVKGFNGSVTLSCSGGPTGSYCVDLPQTVKVNGTALAVSGILFPINTKPGTYTITFTGVSGSLNNRTTATFTVVK
jgi:hypothetical protein